MFYILSLYSIFILLNSTAALSLTVQHYGGDRGTILLKTISEKAEK